MASCVPIRLLSLGLSLLIILPLALSSSGPAATPPLTHHGGRLLTGNLNIGIVWYGPIPRPQKKAILSFLKSINYKNASASVQPQVSSWWQIVESYQTLTKTPPAPASGAPPQIKVKVVNKKSDPNFSYGKVLIKDFIKPLLPQANGGNPSTLAVIVASKGVTVQDMCAGKCSQHGVIDEQPFVAVGDPEEECPECAWPFANGEGKSLGATLPPPNGYVGADAMVMSLAGGLAGAVTNPFGDGFYANGPNDYQIEINTKCKGIFAKGACPGNPGELRKDPKNGGAFNVYGSKESKFLLPGLWDPKSSSCWTPL